MSGYSDVCERITDLSTEREGWLKTDELGKSAAGRSIPVLEIGDSCAEKAVLYVGCHHALESITAGILLRFLDDIVSACRNSGVVYNINVRNLLNFRKLIVVPMLNPDGVEVLSRGPQAILSEFFEEGEPADEELLRWQANARGVDLNHNYDAGFAEYKEIERAKGIVRGAALYSGEFPESEPETAALASFIRSRRDISSILTLHTQGEVIYAQGKCGVGAVQMSRLSRYKLSSPEGTARFGGLADYAGGVLGIPTFTVECGKGKNPLPDDREAELYLDLREMLVSFPLLF